jgi:phospholipase/carboxylesterase
VLAHAPGVGKPAPPDPCTCQLALQKAPMQSISAGPLSGIMTATGPAGEPERDVILLHGFGAPGTDLVGLEHSIQTEVPTRFIYLAAPFTLEGMSGPHAGRAWWHIDMIALHVARMLGSHDELAGQVPEGLKHGREVLTQAISALQTEHGLKLEKTVIGGFSQGAMLSCDYVLRSGAPVEALLQLSGTMICEGEWKPLMQKRPGFRVFQSHSREDQILPFELAERLRDSWKEAGGDIDFVEFRGGHGIAPQVLERLSRFLAKL